MTVVFYGCANAVRPSMQDLYNLCDVYMDAVFNTRCLSDAQVFQQEGWHNELDSADADTSIKGVVFNEMKGVYSQPDSVHYEQVQSQLFPDNNYASKSGGDPEVIPDLTYNKFKEFHATFYHPSNVRCVGVCVAAARIRMPNDFFFFFRLVLGIVPTYSTGTHIRDHA